MREVGMGGCGESMNYPAHSDNGLMRWGRNRPPPTLDEALRSARADEAWREVPLPPPMAPDASAFTALKTLVVWRGRPVRGAGSRRRDVRSVPPASGRSAPRTAWGTSGPWTPPSTAAAP